MSKLLRHFLNFRHCHRSFSQRKDDSFAQCPERVFSGIQPTGVPHLGNYVGAIRNWVRMQERYDSILLSIVDLHSITVQQNPAELRENIQVMAACLIACGINPDKTILFQQSSVKEHAELCWILGCLCSLPRLEHLPQWRDKSKKVSDPKVGLYTYPILQSADIMLYKSTVVPVGEDQLTHLELARDLARAFNRQYGTLFPACNSYIGDVPKIRSLKDPSSKMSKSDNNAASRIDLTDSSSTVRDKIAKAVTDAVSKDITFDPELRPGLSNLIDICSALTGKSSEDIVKLTQDKGMDKKTFKEFVTETVNESIQPISSEMQRILSDRGHLRSILKQGQERASVLAEETIKHVKTLVGLS
ncbi:tryptophan--tRNA ligase, mitochondrial-like [Dreissena polymorpha]|uniref:Tryptophan--tRNA ligase, mitochondrial n=1 Tax=Dreissena polymorpha TaxID=45954 RepID=A0A9D4HWD9_DREPO|nr:tryptophan--tRNA ligase, mitochondrial-like [Dreissena polymorpha]KAH3735322.1 hypothetical protein DPMN_041787 [Dreissena polymorpha]